MASKTKQCKYGSAPYSQLEFSKISPTAKLVAYFRQFSDIAFAKDISEIIQAKAIAEKLCSSTSVLVDLERFVAPAIEARYKSMISAIDRTGITQVLELASGLSFRGIMMTKNPKITYVETDLPELTLEKLSIVERIPEMSRAYRRDNLHFESVDALSMHDLHRAMRHFNDKKPLAIIHEGLFMYLSRIEKEILANNIKDILNHFGGCWITPDIMIQSEMSSLMSRPKVQSVMNQLAASIKTLTGRDLNQEQFKDQADVNSFFKKLGYKITTHPQIDGSYELTSLRKLPMSDEHLKILESSLKLWVLEPAKILG